MRWRVVGVMFRLDRSRSLDMIVYTAEGSVYSENVIERFHSNLRSIRVAREGRP